MHTTNQLLDEIGLRRGNSTTYHLAKALGTSHQTVSHWRKGRSIMSPDFAPRVAALLEWDPAYVMACVEHERVLRDASHKDPLEQTGEILATWERIADKFRPYVPAILAAVALPFLGLFSEPAQASTAKLTSNSDFTAVYIMRSLCTKTQRRRRRRLNPLQRITRWFRTEFPATCPLPA